jgi:hypothetical protein
MSKSIFVVILFGTRSNKNIVQAVREKLPSIRKLDLIAGKEKNGVMVFEDASDSTSPSTVFVLPNGVTDDYKDIYDGERTILSFYGCEPDHQIVQVLTEQFGGIYEVKDKNDWMVVERHKSLDELPTLACLTLSEEYQMQMAG